MTKYLNKQIQKLYNITDEDYVKWCKENKKKLISEESKKEFLKICRERKRR